MPDFDREQLESLVRDPRESLAVELKRWINPGEPSGQSKIVKACLALRNADGGALIVGIRNDGQPDAGDEPSDIRSRFDADDIQSLVGRYSSRQFEVTVDFVERDGVEYPVIRVPSGVQIPVACKRELKDSDDALLLRRDAVYVRTLHSNNTVSSSEARAADWEDIVDRCFENREADIGRFLRRHLQGVDPEAIREALQFRQDTGPRTRSVLDVVLDGFRRFEERVAVRNTRLPDGLGTFECGVRLLGEPTERQPTRELLDRLQRGKRRHSGWSPWVDSTDASDEADRPYVNDGGWEAFIHADSGSFMGPHLQFWRIEPAGTLYVLSAVDDDFGHGHAERPFGKMLDFELVIYRLTEVLSAAISFETELASDPENAMVDVAVRWSNLAGRDVACWSNPGRRHFQSQGTAEQSEVDSRTSIPLDTAPSALAPFVEELVHPLFLLFGGMEIPSRVFEEVVQKALRNRF